MCKAHKVDKAALFFEDQFTEDQEEKPSSLDDSCETASATLLSFLADKEANKHTKVSTALSQFMRQHPIVPKEVMPLAHATLANARAMIEQRLDAG